MLGLALAGQQVSESCGSPADQLDSAWYVIGPCFVIDVAEHVGKVVLTVFLFNDETVMSLFGVAHETYDYTLRHRGLSLLGYGSHNADAAAYAMERMLDGRLQLSPTITAELPLSRFAEGTEMLRRQEAIRILYRPAE